MDMTITNVVADKRWPTSICGHDERSWLVAGDEKKERNQNEKKRS